MLVSVSVSVSVGVGVAERLSSFGSQSDSCPRRLRFGGCEFRDEEKRHTTTRTRARASVSLVLFLRRNGMHLVCGVNSWQLGALLQAASLWSIHWAHVFSFNRRYECSVSFAAFHLFPCLIMSGYRFTSCRRLLCLVYMSVVGDGFCCVCLLTCFKKTKKQNYTSCLLLYN